MTTVEILHEPVLPAAADYAKRGWRVLPIRPEEKRPPMAAWQHAATTDPTTIVNWWTNLYRGHGVGIATGHASGIFVLDVDVANGKTGDETLADLIATHGPLPDTATVITASGGQHIYFQLPDGLDIRNNAGTRLGPGLDIRGEGGQVVAPPTQINGHTYEWDGGQPGPLANPPQWLVDLLTDTPDITPRVMPTADSGDSIAANYNATTTWAQLLTADGWTLTHTLPDGEQRWTRPGKDPRQGISATTGHDGRDCLKVFTDGVPGLNQETAYSRFGYTAATQWDGDRSAFARHLRTLTPYTDPLPPRPNNPTTLNEQPATNRLELAHLIDWTRFWDDDHSDEEWIAYPLIPAGRAVSLYAPAKAGKSMIVLSVVAAIATGRPVLEHRTHTPIDVLYLDFEMTPADLQQRLLELGYGPDDDLTRLHYALLPSLPPLDTIEGATAVLDLCDQTNAQCVIIDTFGRAVEGDEDSADTVRAFYRHTGLALKTRGITYLRTDHSGKDVGKGQRGSSAKNDDVDLIWRLTRTDTNNGHGVRLERTHSRISWVPQELKISRQETDDGYRFHYNPDDTTYPDGTRQDAELMRAHGLDGTETQNHAIKTMAGKLSRRRVITALRMLRESATRRLETTPISVSKSYRRGENGSGAPPRHQNGGAPHLESGAGGAPKGHKGSQGGAPDTQSGAPAASPSGAPPPYKGGAPGPPPTNVKPDLF